MRICVCLPVYLSRYPSWMEGHTNLNFSMEVKWKEIKVKLIDKCRRSRSPGKKTYLAYQWKFQLEFRCINLKLPRKLCRNIPVQTMTQGVKLIDKCRRSRSPGKKTYLAYQWKFQLEFRCINLKLPRKLCRNIPVQTMTQGVSKCTICMWCIFGEHGFTTHTWYHLPRYFWMSNSSTTLGVLKICDQQLAEASCITHSDISSDKNQNIFSIFNVRSRCLKLLKWKWVKMTENFQFVPPQQDMINPIVSGLLHKGSMTSEKCAKTCDKVY